MPKRGFKVQVTLDIPLTAETPIEAAKLALRTVLRAKGQPIPEGVDSHDIEFGPSEIRVYHNEAHLDGEIRLSGLDTSALIGYGRALEEVLSESEARD